MDMLKNILVVHFASSRLLSPGIVTDLHVSIFIPCFIHIADNISIVSDDLNAGPYEIMIYSLDGLPLYTSRVDNLNEDNLISLDDLKPGIYQVSVRGNGYEWHEKLVKVE